jgi:cytoskeletal protein CcmA (bactofilin family)
MMSDGDNGRGTNKQTLIEAGTTFKGSFDSDCPIVVRGRIEGEITGPSLTVSSTGAVSGKVKVGKLSSDGELSGEYDADLVQLSGTVKDQTVIRARSLEVKLAPERGRMQVVFGECDLEVGDVPTMEQSVAAAREPAQAAGASEEDEGSNIPTNPPPPPNELATVESGNRKKKREGRPSTIPPST